MKKVKIIDENVSPVSFEKDKQIFPEYEGGTVSSTSSGTFIISNRWNVEINKSLPSSGNQITSPVVSVVDNLGGESFVARTSSSQMGEVKFRETRLLSKAEIKRRTMEALKHAEDQRKELLLREASLESES